MKKDDCIFCKLANGDIPTNSIYEDDVVKVIFDASPAARDIFLYCLKTILMMYIQWMMKQQHMYSRLQLSCQRHIERHLTLMGLISPEQW